MILQQPSPRLQNGVDSEEAIETLVPLDLVLRASRFDRKASTESPPKSSEVESTAFVPPHEATCSTLGVSCVREIVATEAPAASL